MSLILEALKKSEEQRRLGEVPGLNTAYRAQPRRRGGPLSVLLISMLLIAGAYAGWRWHLEPVPDAEMPTVAAPTPQLEEPVEPLDTTTELNRQDSVAATDSPTATTVPDSSATTSAELEPDRPKSERESEAIPPDMEILRTVDTSAGVERGTEFANSPDLRRPFEHTPEWEAQEQPPEAAATPSADTPASADTSTAVARSEPVPSDPNAVPATYELPYTLRRELPELRLTMHFYSSDVASRFVILNGERRLEGDSIGEDIAISEIVPDGVVLLFRGQRTLLPRLGT